MIPAFDPRPPLRVLCSHDVRFVIIGGIAGVLLGSPSLTFDLDLCYERSRQNLEALAAALTELKATLRGVPSGLPFVRSRVRSPAGCTYRRSNAAQPIDCR